MDEINGYWTPMYGGLAAITAPMLDAGWRIVKILTDGSHEGPAAFFDLERDGEAIELELTDEGWLVAYPNEGEGDADEPTEPLFQLRAEEDVLIDEFLDRGWL
jgi:hypothetical protein